MHCASDFPTRTTVKDGAGPAVTNKASASNRK